jgi:hypothetical protein
MNPRALILLLLLLLSSAPAMAYPTQADVRELHQELEEILQQLDALEKHQAGVSDEQRVADHLALVERHLQSVRLTICGDCTDHTFAKSPYRSAAEACGDAQVISSQSLQDYTTIMRAETHKMHDHIGHVSHEKSPFKREQLMHWYDRRVLTALRRAKPTCQSDDAARR